MTQANRMQIAFTREVTPGTTPPTPRMRKGRITGESLFYRPLYNQSEELRDDRMIDDPTQIMFESGGDANVEFSYPVDQTWLSELIASTFFNEWSNTPQRANDGVPDSVITEVAATTDVVTVTAGEGFVAGQLVRFSGFGQAANNGTFAVTTGSATAPAFLGAGFAAETAPPGTARMKAVGVIGAAGDITATATGLASTALDFTTLGLVVGQWIKIGGTGTANRFATEANNGFARITAITANVLTLDNLPAGWAIDAGAGKTIKLFFGDQIKNGLIPIALTLERGFLGQPAPTYIVNRGMIVGQAQFQLQNRAKITSSFTFTGMGGGQSLTPLDADADPVTTNKVMSSHVNVGRLAEGGAQIVSPNYARSLTFTINNNLRTIEDLTEDAPVGINEGECTVTGTLETYFGSNATLEKFFTGTVTAFNAVVTKDNQAVIWQLPRITLSGGGNPSATGKNTDVMASFEFTASKDTATAAHVLLDRIEYYEP